MEKQCSKKYLGIMNTHRKLEVNSILPYFSHTSAKCTYRIFFSTQTGTLVASLTLFVFLLPISIRFRYLDHLVANRMAPSMCPENWGMRCGSWFQAILYHISAIYLAFMRSTYFEQKCCINLTCLNMYAHKDRQPVNTMPLASCTARTEAQNTNN